jgi:hypothetical protein
LALSEIQKLYAIERQIEAKPVNERLSIRQARAGPILDKMKIWLDKSLHQVPPKSALGKALHYLAHEWPRLTPYVGDGRLPIDNNPCENAIRPFVIGRNYVHNPVMCSPASINVMNRRDKGVSPNFVTQHVNIIKDFRGTPISYQKASCSDFSFAG